MRISSCGSRQLKNSSVWAYDPATNTWSPAGNMAVARDEHTATLLHNGKVLVVGGLNSSGFLTFAELYDPASNSWSSAGSMAVARSEHTATLLSDGTVLIAGGFGQLAAVTLA